MHTVNMVGDMVDGKRMRMLCLVEDDMFDCDNVIRKGCRCTINRVGANED